MIEFNLILKAAKKPVIGGLLWRLPIGTLLMLGFEFAGGNGSINAWVGHVFSVAGWAYILYDILLCETGGWQDTARRQAERLQLHADHRTAGWSIYPFGNTTKASWEQSMRLS